MGDGGADAIAGFAHVNGQINLTVTTKNSFTGSLVLDGKKNTLRGTFNGNNSSIENTGFRVSLVRSSANSGGSIAGNVTTLSGTMAYTARPVAYSGMRGDVFPLAGKKVTASLLGTGNRQTGLVIGHGFSSVALGKDGTATFAGKLPDGSKITGSARADDSGTGGLMLPVAIPIPSTKGLLCGELAVTEDQTDGASQLSGLLAWLRGSMPKSNAYPAGLLCEIELMGSLWNPNSGMNLLTGKQEDHSFTLNIDPGSDIFASAIDQSGAWPANNKPKLNTSTPGASTFTVSARTGLFSGKVVMPPVNGAKGKATAFQGIMLATPINVGNMTFIHGVGFLPGTDKSVPVEVTTP